MNDLMDSLVDEDPVVFEGLLSSKVGSSLYTNTREVIGQSHTYLQQSTNGTAYHRGGRVKVKRNYGMAGRFLNPGSCDYF